MVAIETDMPELRGRSKENFTLQLYNR
jgi:hypothetical protein